MDMIQNFEEYITSYKANIPFGWFIVNLFLSGVLALILNQIYIKYGYSFSNRRLLGRNFLLITMTTVLIISIVKSSLALSLGLVGALSIVRFRAAIKEPEELTYLFLAIGIGLGFGADQGTITTIAFIIISSIIIFLRKISRETFEHENMLLTVISQDTSEIAIDKIVETLKANCSSVNLKRLDEEKDKLEATFLIEIRSFEKLNTTKIELQKLNESLKFTFLDNKGIH